MHIFLTIKYYSGGLNTKSVTFTTKNHPSRPSHKTRPSRLPPGDGRREDFGTDKGDSRPEPLILLLTVFVLVTRTSYSIVGFHRP
jgi:hypothetical protein